LSFHIFILPLQRPFKGPLFSYSVPPDLPLPPSMPLFLPVSLTLESDPLNGELFFALFSSLCWFTQGPGHSPSFSEYPYHFFPSSGYSSTLKVESASFSETLVLNLSDYMTGHPHLQVILGQYCACIPQWKNRQWKKNPHIHVLSHALYHGTRKLYTEW
jgi:hypothetical protein